MPPLFSGSGRHRRPRQAPSFVVKAGAAGVGIAIPFLGATAANAADAGTWDKVAECESGGLWSANDDNGFYGGLQLDEETWDEYGGTEYAERPDLASRGQQIEVAERILQAEGRDAWSDCAENAGLSEDSPETPDLDGDASGSDSEAPVPERPYPSAPSDSASEDGTGGSEESGDGDSAGFPDNATQPAPDESADASESSDPSEDPSDSDESADSGSPSGSEDSDEAAPEDSGDSADSGDAGDSGDADESGDAASPGADAGDDGYLWEPADPIGPGSGGREESDEHPSREDDDRGDAGSDAEDHRVSKGESLSGIADEYEVRGGWAELYERNRDVVGSDPDLIRPGQELNL